MLSQPSMTLIAAYDPASLNQHSRNNNPGNRLRSASDLEDLGIIEPREKGRIKELMSNGDEKLQEALDKFEEGDSNHLENLVNNGVISKKSSIDLLEDLDFHFLQQAGLEQLETQHDGSQQQNFAVGNTPIAPTPSSSSSSSGQTPSASLPPVPSSFLSATSSMLSAALNSGNGNNTGGGGWRNRTHDLTLDDITFDEEFDEGCRGRSNSITSVNSMSGLGMNSSSMSFDGQNYTDVFDHDTFSDHHRLSSQGSNMGITLPLNGGGGGSNQPRPNTRPSSRRNVLTISTSKLTCTTTPSDPIDIPSSNHRSKNRGGNSIAALVDAGDRMNEFDHFDAINNGVGHMDHEDDMNNGTHYVGAYSPESRRRRVARFMEKRGRRIWTKKVKYDVRKNFADSRMRVKGRFVRKEDEELLRDLLSLT